MCQPYTQTIPFCGLMVKNYPANGTTGSEKSLKIFFCHFVIKHDKRIKHDKMPVKIIRFYTDKVTNRTI